MRSTPLNSKTMWTIYVGQVSLAAAFHQTVATLGAETPTTVLLSFVAAIALVAMVGVLGISVVDRAVVAVTNVWGNDDAKQNEPKQPDAA
jgi:hypothetical protein